MEKSIWEHIQSVRKQSPLVHNITNYVVMNNTANALLAIGASPIMAHAPEEINEMVKICSATVINIGTLDEYWVSSMYKAAHTANQMGKPWILDPVGAGATNYRNSVLGKLLELKPWAIRGNASEILSLANQSKSRTKGVDSTAHSSEAIDAAKYLNEKYDSVVCISGETDIITDGKKTVYIHNGHPLMTKVTGLGCSATAVIGAFLGTVENKLEAVVAGTALFSIAGELAEKISSGPGSLQVNLLDTLHTINEKRFMESIRFEVA